ncbi:transporter [Methylosinus sp. R-45379]|uniref:RDD family protein n=1 Tax=unclassified Methylosinus TaxID=2624500 RepID=UPI00046681F3|nr:MULTISPECIES: RDD family protein [unclassified Methylosinus]OAI25248.1 transporter [Methylosinus sp. R-45379]TDX61505.1 putative RDD family membrane protein YckC [Methylosinus sp. sav-2]
MYDAGGDGRLYPVSPGLPPREALAGVRTRRILALCLDFFVVALLSAGLWLGLLVLSFGLSAFLLPPLFPVVAFFYNGLTVSGWRRATPGMRAMDLEVRLADGAPAPFLNAAVQGVLFYVSWLFPPLLLVTFITSDKRCLHDILADVIVLRRAD